MAKTDRNSIYLGRGPYIPDRLYIMVMYLSFYRFLKNLKFGLKFKGVSLRYYRKHWFVPKTDRNSVFLGRDPYIPDRLYIMVLYISFYGF
jgi:hypothetical protein